jgi:hypothetical protein
LDLVDFMRVPVTTRHDGSSSDAESAEWLAQKFRLIGLSDVRVQSLPIATPVWEPVQPWEIIDETN